MISSIISAIGNNSSVYPLFVRDCLIEVPTKIYKTYKQNDSDREIAYLATREKLIDEYATSAVWLGGIPLIGRIANYAIKKRGFNPDVSLALLKNEEMLKKIDEQILSLKRSNLSNFDKIQKLTQKREKIFIQSLSGNIEKFKNIKGAEEAIKELEKVKANPKTYKNLLGAKFAAEMAIPIALMGFIIPKIVFAITANTRRKKAELMQNKLLKADTFTSQGNNIESFLENSNQPTFGGCLGTGLTNLTTVQKMAITDGGYAVGRVTTARKKSEAIDIAFKMAGMMYLNFVAPKQIEKLLNKISKKTFNLNVDLDPKILADKNFLKQIRNNSLILPKTDKLPDMLEFIDNPENNKTLFVQYAEKLEKIKLISDGSNGKIRDLRFFIEETKLADLRNNMKSFADEVKRAESSGLQGAKIEKSIKNILRKSKALKMFNILANVGISSYLLACALPNMQYALRRRFLGTEFEPGLIDTPQNSKKSSR